MKYELVNQDWKMKLDDISGVAVDSKDNVYVLIRAPLDPVIIYNKNGELIGSMGRGCGIQGAHGIDVDPDDNILLVHRQVVQKFDRDGKLLLTLGTLDTINPESGSLNNDFKTVKRGGGPFCAPAKVATDKDGDIFVCDGYGNARIHHFAKDGTLVKSWGEPGTEPGQFNIPHGIGVDQVNGDVYVCDRENFRIQIFDADGNLKTIWNNMWRPTDVKIKGDYVYVSEIGELLFTDNVLFDPKFHRHPSQTRIFDKKGNELCQIGGGNGGLPGNFMGAHGVAVDSDDTVYVCEVNNWNRHDAYAAWPGGEGAPVGTHQSFQKFKKA